MFFYNEQDPDHGEDEVDPNTPLVAPSLVWMEAHRRNLYHVANPDGLYLVRDHHGKRLATVVMLNRNWSTSIGFSEYAYLGPIPAGWKGVVPA